MADRVKDICEVNAIENVVTEAAVECTFGGQDSDKVGLVPPKWRGTTQDQLYMATMGRLQQLRASLRLSLSPGRQFFPPQRHTTPSSSGLIHTYYFSLPTA
jgi:hypothetical protein